MIAVTDAWTVTGAIAWGAGFLYLLVKTVNWRRHVKAPAPLKPPVWDSVDRLNAWKDEPGTVPDKLGEELERLLTEGDRRD